MLFLRYSGRSVNEDHIRYLKAHRKMGFFVFCDIKRFPILRRSKWNLRKLRQQ